MDTCALGAWVCNCSWPINWQQYMAQLHFRSKFLSWIRQKAQFSSRPHSQNSIILFCVYVIPHQTRFCWYLSLRHLPTLEPFFPHVHTSWKSAIVCQTLDRCKWLQAIPTHRKQALTINDLQLVINHYSSSPDHDNLLFVAQILISFFALMRLGEITNPDNNKQWNPSKVIKQTSVAISHDTFQFFLPSHKADKFFEWNTILLTKTICNTTINPFIHFQACLHSCDMLFPFSSPLWLRQDGSIPTRSFFIDQLHALFDSSVGGQSMHAGKATMMAENGAPPSLIQATGWWSSDAFHIYIRKKLILIQALLHACNDASGSHFSWLSSFHFSCFLFESFPPPFLAPITPYSLLIHHHP